MCDVRCAMPYRRVLKWKCLVLRCAVLDWEISKGCNSAGDSDVLPVSFFFLFSLCVFFLFLFLFWVKWILGTSFG